MQEQRSAVGSLPETLGFDHGCTSSDAAIDHQQVRWNDIHSSGHDMLPEYIALHGDPPNVPYLNPTSQGGHNLSGWSVGEPSSGGTQAHARHNEWKTEHGVAPMLEERHYEPANTLSLNNVSVNCSSNQLGHAPLFVQSSSNAILQDLNMTAGFVGHRTDDSLIMDESDGSQNLQNPSATSSSDPFRISSGSGGFLVEGNDGRPGSSMEGQRASCKRKVFDGSIGQSSRSGSPGYYHQAESSHWQAASGRFNAGSSLSISTPSDNVAGINLRSAERVNSRLGLGVAGAASGNSLAVNVEGNPTPRRNYRARTIPSREQDFLPINVFPGSTNMSSQQSSRVPPANIPLNVTPPPTEGSTTSQRQAVVVRVPSLRRSSHSSRWNNGSSSRPGNSSSSGVRDGVPQEEPNSTNMPRNISEHPMFIPATERRNSAQDTVNWSSTGGNISFAGNVASSSRTGPTPGVHQVSGSSRVIHRHSPQYPRRLSEFVRRSLLSSIGSESGGQGPSNPPAGSGSGSGSSQEVALPLGAANHSRLSSHPRSAMLVERQLDGAQGIPFPLRTLTAGGEGRNSRLVSEIRSVLDLMRRGEGLRFEDVMILDQSVLFGMADIHDRHRDMRLDVDNMSYEELLALEERIGNVNTGLTEETISDRLKRRKFFSIALSSNLEVEPCCVCQEEYKDGEDVGTLDCGHEFHSDCIKQWLVQKNICPICKTNALSK